MIKMMLLEWIRSMIPVLFGVGGAYLLSVMAIQSRWDLQASWAIGAIAGFIIGMAVRRLIPNPKDKGV